MCVLLSTGDNLLLIKPQKRRAEAKAAVALTAKVVALLRITPSQTYITVPVPAADPVLSFVKIE